ncbi:ABC transporter permease [Methylobrevis albus]|uniref:ABC transporter permease n=1 Tax=Methylobrevis albus TaxID=2793297 RepID=A0A931HY47_9HYPH|nr:ABC transporter permease [Methylobrevis albus]MBH0236567.1 ABC transporter permease [Methylobrevis albus]
MRIELIRRAEQSRRMALLSPVIAVGLTVVFSAAVFLISGVDPLAGLYQLFIAPLTDAWSLSELVVKAVPLVLIGVGLAVCYLSNNWNIGAEGQFTIGAITGSMIPLLLPDFQTPFTLPLMLVAGILGGAAYGLIPGLLKTRFGANEILTSLMLVYVATLFLDWLVRGPWRDPMGYGFPQTERFNSAARMIMLGDGRMSVSALVTLVVVALMAVMLAKTLKGFEIKVLGASPRAGAFAGFSAKKMTLFAFAISGGLAGLAGIMEVSGVIGKLQPSISPGYGFAAIIVAFLGRLNPVGILIAGLVLALTYLGGEGIQVALGVSKRMSTVLQGVLLFFVLACDTLILYRVRFISSSRKAGAHA